MENVSFIVADQELIFYEDNKTMRRHLKNKAKKIPTILKNEYFLKKSYN